MAEPAALPSPPTGVHPWVAAAPGTVRFGISIYPQPADWGEFIDVVQRAEALGFDSYWSYDHPTANADCWTALTALALASERLRLGTMVGCVYYRGPYLLARMAADVDRLSGGRLVLGLGIGDNVPEFTDMGIPFPPAPERQRALEETIAIVRGLWSGEPFAFEGELFRASNALPFLPPVQEPRVPILIAGGGERVTLRQVARYADVSNMGSHAWTGGAFTTDDLTRKYATLARHCDDAGRPAGAVLRSHFTMPLILVPSATALDAKLATIPKATLDFCATSLVAGTPDDAIRYYRALEAAGVQYVVVNILDGDWETIDLLGREVMPAFA